MPVSMTIRGLPDRTRDELAARAARAGMSLQEYMRAELVKLAEQPDPAEFWDRVRHRLLVTGSRLPADVILEAKDQDRR